MCGEQEKAVWQRLLLPQFLASNLDFVFDKYGEKRGKKLYPPTVTKRCALIVVLLLQTISTSETLLYLKNKIC